MAQVQGISAVGFTPTALDSKPAATLAGIDASRPQIVEPVLGAGDSTPQDSFVPQDPETQFPSLDVITQRILNSMRQALKVAADRAERQEEAHDVGAKAPVVTPVPKSEPSNSHTSSDSGTPDQRPAVHDNPVLDHLVGAAARSGSRGPSGQELLGGAKMALSQATPQELGVVHRLANPIRLFLNQTKQQ